MSTMTRQGAPEPIEIDATRSEILEVASYLQGHLGQRITAYLSGLKDQKIVGQWASGRVQPRDTASLRLRHAYQAARLLVEAFGDQSTKAWFFGTNSQLGGEAPAYVLRHSSSPEQVAPVLRAARSFAEAGRRVDAPSKESRVVQARVARLLMEEIQRYNEQPKTARSRISTRLKDELLKTEAPTERILVLDQAQREISEQIEEFVKRLKKDLQTSKSVSV